MERDENRFKIDEKRKRIELSGFNNLTKSLSFNIYDISYTPSSASQRDYINYIDEKYNSQKLNRLLHEVVRIIDAHVLSYSTQDYEPSGASATILISEESIHPTSGVMHLDKSHLAAHTYPETNQKSSISTFRVDIDVSTCGRVSPLRALDFMMSNFDADIVTVDYRIRGFTRDVNGTKYFIDHEIYDITDFISESILDRYNCLSRNISEENIYNLKMMLNDFDLQQYLFKSEMKMDNEGKELASGAIQKEMSQIFMRRNY